MTIYISGKISNEPDFKKNFQVAENYIRACGHNPLNPCWITANLKYLDYMKIDLAMLDVADAIYMLNGFEDSNGANFELDYARFHGKRIFFESDKEKLTEY